MKSKASAPGSTLLAFPVLAALLASSALAADFSFAGNFRQDDEHRYISITASKAALVTVRTLSYAGGTNAAGLPVPAGGFDPTLSVFDSSGALIALNRDGGCGNVAADPITQLCWDSRLNFSVSPGVYQVVLTQGENMPRGPALGDFFVYDGLGNFTADPEMPASRGFWDLSLHQRTGAFAVDITGVDSALLGLTPAVTALVSAASQLPGQLAPNDILTYYDPGLAGGPVIVSIAGQAVTVLYSGAGQVNFVVPASVAAQPSAVLQISRTGTILVSTALNVAAAAPALFTSGQQGTGQAAILNGDYSLNSGSLPAKGGDYILVFGTGFGLELPPGTDGNAVLASGVTATVGGSPVEVTYAGSAPGQTPGLQQINLHLPTGVPTGTAVAIQLTVAGVPTQPGTTVAIR